MTDDWLTALPQGAAAASGGGVSALSQLGNARELAASVGPVAPALGLAWANCATVRPPSCCFPSHLGRH